MVMEKSEGCIFCKISNGTIPAFKIWENKAYFAILDIFPNIKGQTLVIPKKHLESYAFDLSDSDYDEFMHSVRTVVRLLEKGLKVKRVHLVLEGTGINHLHAKLYPAIGMESKDEILIAEQKAHFDKYTGYVTTLMGERADDKELEQLANEIRKTANAKNK